MTEPLPSPTLILGRSSLRRATTTSTVPELAAPPRAVNVVAVRARDRTPIEREPGWFLPALHPRPDAWELTPSGVRFDVAASCDLRFLSARATHAALPGFTQASHVEEVVYVHVEVRHSSL